MIAQPTNHNKTHRRQGNSHMKLNKPLIGINMVPTPKTNADYTLFIVRIYNERFHHGLLFRNRSDPQEVGHCGTRL
jgi:hypothetical protein